MSETKNPGERLSVTPTKGTLTLKRGVEQGVVRQSFSHGRTKAVVVEKVKRRTLGPGEAKPEPAIDARAGARRTAGKAAAAPAATPTPAAPGPALKPSGVVLRALSDEELNRRAHALDDARVREAEERRVAEEEARRRADREGRERVEREAAELAMVNRFTGVQLDLAFGRPNVVHAALLAGSASDGFLARYRNLERFRAIGPGGQEC